MVAEGPPFCELDLGGLELDGAPVRGFELRGKGLVVKCISYGLYVTEIHAPDRSGRWADLAIGFKVPEDAKGYTDGRSMYFGCVVGRFANRIKEGKFSLDGVDYQLPAINNGPNALHGGARGWDKRHWDVLESGDSPSGPFVLFGYSSPDGEEGYPGGVYCKVRYSVVDGSTLRMEYTVEHKAGLATVVNVTNHTYFNLAGYPEEGEICTVLDHHLSMPCEAFTPTDSTAIPTGEIRQVAGTPFDFTGAGRKIGELIGEKDEQLEYAIGYDHNFVLPEAPKGTMQLCARVSEASTGRKLECLTTEPGVQFYTGNFMSASNASTKGQPKGGGYRTGFCLETQHFPDSPNHPDFPSTRLGPGETYQSTTEYKFSAE